MDRLDILSLEASHLQCNIIHLLREPDLYKPLVFEDDYIWGARRISTPDVPETNIPWAMIIGQNRTSAKFLRALSRAWMIRYPALFYEDIGSIGSEDPILPDADTIGAYVDMESRRNVYQTLQNTVRHILLSGIWSDDAKRHYDALAATQILKQHVLYDKLCLCWWAWRTFVFQEDISGPVEWPGAQKMGRFLVLRSVTLAKVRRYVERLLVLQRQFERVLDLSLQEDPRPTASRRREQGIYSSYLSDFCRDVRDHTEALLTTLVSKSTRSGGRVSKAPLTIHQWGHDFTSSIWRLRDALGAELDEESVDKKENRKRRPLAVHIDLVQTSFWMPDRPDLQTIIAHEVAHSLVVDHFGNFNSPAFDTCKDNFAALMRLINVILVTALHSSDTDTTVDQYHSERSILGEIACDFLAASVMGHAYLFALALELMGAGLESLFDSPTNDIDLEQADYLSNTLGTPDLRFDWYLRIRLVAAWVEITDYADKDSSLFDLLRSSVVGCADALLCDVTSTYGARGEADRKYWRALSGELCETSSASGAARLVGEWRKKRDKMGRRLENREQSAGYIDPFERRTRPFSRQVRGMLFGRYLGMKQTNGRIMRYVSGTVGDYVKEFDRLHLGREFRGALEDGDVLGGLAEERDIFGYVFDIPWQCALMDAVDFVGSPWTNTFKTGPGVLCGDVAQWIPALQALSPMGRDLYQVGFEFFLRISRAPGERLADAVRLVLAWDLAGLFEMVERQLRSHRDGDLVVEAGGLRSEFNDWLGEGQKEVDPSTFVETLKRHAAMWENAEGMYTYRGDELLQLSEDVPASSLIRVKNSLIDNDARRILDRIQGYKLRTLSYLLERVVKFLRDKLIQNYCIDNVCRIRVNDDLDKVLELLVYLRIRDQRPEAQSTDVLKTKYDYDTCTKMLFDSFEVGRGSWPAWEMNDPAEFPATQLHVLSRISFSGCGRTVGDSNSDADQKSGLNRQANLSSIFKDKQKNGTIIKNQGSSFFSSGRRRYAFVPMLGRFDFIGIQPVRMLQRRTVPEICVSSGDNKEYVGQHVGKYRGMVPFIARREIVIPFRLPSKGGRILIESDVEGAGNVAAVLSIVLVQRSARLSFLARLLGSIAQSMSDGREVLRVVARNKRDLTISDIGSLFENNDFGFLGEGWGDVVLVFSGDVGESRLRDIFSIQKAIYGDFLVQRTELILHSDSVEVALRHPRDYAYHVVVRVKSDREIKHVAENFSEKILAGKWGIRVLHTPGRTDFLIEPEAGGDKAIIRHVDMLNCLENAGDDIDQILSMVAEVRCKSTS